MASNSASARESRLRRVARAHGFAIHKCPRRDPDAWDHGTYSLVDTETRALVLGSSNGGSGMSLDDIEAHLAACGVEAS